MNSKLVKKIQTRFSNYLQSTTPVLKKSYQRCLKDMTLGILKSKSVHVNKIAVSLQEPLALKKVCKRLRTQYLQDGFAPNVLETHLKICSKSISDDDFLIMDGTDIQKKRAKCMEGLDFVKDGDVKGKIGPGYNLLNVIGVSGHKTITPVYSKPYSYEMGTLSSNNEIKDITDNVNDSIQAKPTWVYDRGADTKILKDQFITTAKRLIIRLKKNTKVIYKDKEVVVKELVKKVEFTQKAIAVKTKKNKTKLRTFALGILPVTHIVKGKEYPIWLVVTRDVRTGGICFLMVKADQTEITNIAKWAFKGYGLRWKIEEYHRHVKQEYKLESIQIKTFTGIQSMLAVLVVAMHTIYRNLESMHFDLLLLSSYNLLNKGKPEELVNFVYYKISKIVSFLLMPTKSRRKKIDYESVKVNLEPMVQFP